MNGVFIAGLALVSGMALAWGFRNLPGERWQMIASAPARKIGEGQWEGVNFTWYGFLTATAYASAVALFIILYGSLGASFTGAVVFIILTLLVCAPASKIVARIVEGKLHTFTVGGAVFTGIIVCPWLAVGVDRLFSETPAGGLPVLPAISAAAVAYSFGEGIGRLACLSFGCCYGVSLSSLSPWSQKTLKGLGMIFHGKTKKIAYEGGLEGVPVAPVQAMTSVIYMTQAVLSSWLFLNAYFMEAFIVSITVTQFWRVFSETLRADYRGGGKISAYQIMGIVAPFYAALVMWLIGQPPDVGNIDAARGLLTLWDPWVILFLQSIWLAAFFYTGKSRVTASRLSFYVRMDCV
ncbi:MAG: prolipoprotein diacylglyceryl transferase [Nitrospinae bacterium]|nr:prolipoprotein diacylglyceryl transferase [Nitrospinota bacterium]